MEDFNKSGPGALVRSKGGFRRLVETELGEEQWCGSCGEFWPTDGEFFHVSGNSLGYQCKACLAEHKALRVKRSM